MNRHPNKPRRIAQILALTLVLTVPAVTLKATFPVLDYANLVQAITQVSKTITQIQNQITQIQIMYRNLQRITDPSWRELANYFRELNALVRQGQALGYSTEGLFTAFRELTPGFVPRESQDFDALYAYLTETTLDTLAATLDSARAQADRHVSTQNQLFDARRFADNAQGNLEALHASNMLSGHIAQEVAKLNQLLAASMNAQNVYYGARLSHEATEEATHRWLIEGSRGPFTVYTGQGGLTAVPAGWPYPCFGCAG